MLSTKSQNLPIAATPFVGRAKEIEAITTSLANPACRLLTLVGPGGIGKTRLAIEAARAQSDLLNKDVVFIALQPLSSSDLILPTLAEAIPSQFHSGRDLKEQLLDYFRDKSTLLVFDNFEHLLDGAELLSDILKAAPDVKMIVTSRERLNLQEEWVLDVLGMPVPSGEMGSEIMEYDVVQLFLQNARRVQLDFALTEVQKSSIVRICRLVGGMPLGIELAAAWVRALSCEEIAAEIERSLDVLTINTRNTPSRHRNVRAAFEPTWNRLSDEERSVFKKLSVFQGGFTREAASYIAGASLPTLLALIDKSLLRGSATGLYDLHELLRQYGEEQLNISPDESHQTYDLHCAYYTTLLHQKWARLNGREQKQAMQEIESEIGNVRAGWLWAVKQQKEVELGKAIDSLWFYYDTRSQYQEGAVVFRVAKEALTAYEPDGVQSVTYGKLMAAEGMLYFGLTLTQECKALLEDSLEIFRYHGALSEIAHMVFRLGEVNSYLECDYPQAQQHYRESLALYRQLNNPQGEAFALAWLGMTYYYLGDFSEAWRLGHESLAQCEALGSQMEASQALIVLSVTAIEMGAYQEAKRLGKASLKIGLEVGIHYVLNLIYIILGHATCVLGEYAESKRYLYEHLKMQTRFMPQVLYALVEIANLLAELGEPERAANLLGMVLYQPVHYDLGKYTLLRLRTRLEAELPPEIYTAALEWGRTFDLTATVQTLLVEFSQSVEETSPNMPLSSTPSGPDALSERELEILRLIADGLSNAEIAQKLFLTVGTVKVHTHNLYGKLGTSSRTQAVAQAQKLGLL
jgi:predicted ATPase/DNA-binding CsgD family transcriptional regulator